MKGFFVSTLQRKLISSFVGVALVSIAIVGVVSYILSRTAIIHQVTSGLESTAQNKELTMVQYLRGKTARIEAIAADTHIDELVAKLNENPQEFNAISQELSKYLVDEKLTTIAEGGELLIMNNTGKIIASTESKEIGEDKSTDDLFSGVKGRTHIKDIYLSTITNKPAIAFSTPLVDKSGKQIGIITNRVTIDRISEIMRDVTGLGETGESYILNRDGLMITDSRYEKDTFLKQKIETEPVKLFREQGKEMVGEYKDYRGVLTFGASNGSDVNKEFGLGWTILTEIDSEEELAAVGTLAWWTVVIALIAAGLSGLAAYFISKAIADPIKEIANIAVKVSEGDLTQTVGDVRSRDEVGRMAEAFRSMITNLRKMVSQVLDVSDRVSTSSQELSSSAQEMNATSEEVSSTVQQIAKGTESQAQKVDETQKVMERMSVSVLQVSKSAQDAAGQAARSSETAQKGGELTKEARNKIVQIASAVVSSAGIIKKLGERGEQIGEIVGVITNIADQTNLLALNAAIEAARAGEYGRGFAVVAEEVRKLAESSAKAAEEIGKMIKDVQKETAQAVVTIEGVAKEASSVNDLTSQVVQSLTDIIKNVEGVAAMIEQVSAASQEQATGAKQVSISVSDIAAVAEETASSTEEASASTEEMTASMEEMSASAQELADMGIQLRNLVAMFKTGEEDKVQVVREIKEERSAKNKFDNLRVKAGILKKKVDDLRARGKHA